MNYPHPSPLHVGAAFLSDLASAGPLKQRVALAVAHPDDESIGAGGQLHRFENLTLIVGTDGAPIDGRDARRTGHETIQAYARTRDAELRQALSALKLPDHGLIQLGLPDGELIMAIDPLVHILTDTFERNEIDVAMTHAYEGGHPDHDALALATHLAARRCPKPPCIIEMPYYHAGPHGWVLQTFPDEDLPALTLRLDAERWARKCAMLDAHRTQAEMLTGFRQPLESFRLAPQHNFMQPPRPGRWLYDQVAPNLHPEAWLARARAAIAMHGGA